jgi:hypothetical protein
VQVHNAQPINHQRQQQQNLVQEPLDGELFPSLAGLYKPKAALNMECRLKLNSSIRQSFIIPILLSGWGG